MNHIMPFSLELRDRLEKAMEWAKKSNQDLYLEQSLMYMEFCMRWLDMIDEQIKKPADVSVYG